MTAQTLKLKNQTLTLPKDWRGKEVFVRRYNDTIVIKKVEKPEFWESWEKIRAFSKNIKKKDIEKAILWARKSQKK
jgi:hypothetical protein